MSNATFSVTMTLNSIYNMGPVIQRAIQASKMMNSGPSAMLLKNGPTMEKADKARKAIVKSAPQVSRGVGTGFEKAIEAKKKVDQTLEPPSNNRSRTPFDHWPAKIDPAIKAVGELEKKVGQFENNALAIGNGAEKIISGIKTFGAPGLKLVENLAQPSPETHAEQGPTATLVARARNAVRPAAQNVVSFVKSAEPYVESIEKGIKSYKELVGWVATARQYLGELSGALKTIKTGLSGIGEGFGMIKQAAGSITSSLGGLRTGLNFIRTAGAQIGSGLQTGVQAAWPYLTKISGWVSGFVRQFMAGAIRIAAGWVVAMGPVGWIIAGVTVVIGAAIWAWKSNFLGFKDACIAIWQTISNWAKTIWDNITGWIISAIDTAKRFINSVKGFLGFGSQNESASEQKARTSTIENRPALVHQPINNAVTVTQTNTFNIQSTDPSRASEQVARHLDNMKYTFSRTVSPRAGYNAQ